MHARPRAGSDPAPRRRALDYSVRGASHSAGDRGSAGEREDPTCRVLAAARRRLRYRDASHVGRLVARQRASTVRLLLRRQHRLSVAVMSLLAASALVLLPCVAEAVEQLHARPQSASDTQPSPRLHRLVADESLERAPKMLIQSGGSLPSEYYAERGFTHQLVGSVAPFASYTTVRGSPFVQGSAAEKWRSEQVAKTRAQIAANAALGIKTGRTGGRSAR